mgnify:CR=1 FL=1
MKYLSYLFLFLISIQSFAYDFDNLFNQMNADISETNDKAMKARLKKNNSIKAYCNSLKRLPFSWKEDFSRENRININSITFLGATLREGTYSSGPYVSCSVKSSSDRGVCNHTVLFFNKTPRISNECLL